MRGLRDGVALTEITTTHTGKPTEKLFQDALGREVRKGAQRFDGHYLFTDNPETD